MITKIVPIRVFKKDNLKIYSIIIFRFVIQNFIVFLYPSLIFDVLNIYSRFNTGAFGPKGLFYLKEFDWIKNEDKGIITVLFTIILAIITLILISNKTLRLEEKFAYFSLISLFLSIYAWRVLLILIPFSLLVFIQFLKKEEKVLDFFKKNKILVIGLFSILGINFMPEFNFTFYKYLPILEEYPYFILVSLRWIFFVSILGISMLILHLKKDKI